MEPNQNTEGSNGTTVNSNIETPLGQQTPTTAEVFKPMVFTADASSNPTPTPLPEPDIPPVTTPTAFTPTGPTTNLSTLPVASFSGVTPAAPTAVSPAVPAITPPANVPTPTAVSVDGSSPATQQPWVSPISGAVVSGGTGSARPPKFAHKRTLFILAGSTLVTLLLTAGAVFGLYVPNTPTAVWSTSINRSGKALDTLVTTATEPKKLQEYKTSELGGTLTAKLQGSTYAGDFTAKFDKTSLDGGLNFTAKNTSGPDTTFSAKVLTQIPANSSYPDMYFQITGLKAMGLDSFYPGVGGYDGKWIVADSAYLQSIGANYLSGADNNVKNITAADVSEVARASSSVTKDYLFSTDEAKAVLVKQSFVGKETVDGVKAYHYKVGVDIAHAKAYCVALSDKLLSTNAYKKISGSSTTEIADAKKTATKDCPQSIDQTLKSADSFDVWLDGKYKLIYKVRAYDKVDKGIYTDVGQVYKGDDNLSLFVAYHDTKGKADGKFVLDTNIKTNVTTGTLTYAGTSSENPYDVKLTLAAKTSSETVKITKPAGALPIQQLLDKLGVSTGAAASSTAPAGGSGSIGTKAKDAERQTDINALQAHLEAYNAQNGVYPTLIELNTAQWRATNMKGLDPTALQDPSGTSPVLVATATATQYGYQATSCTNDGCAGFTLTAKLSDASSYTKTNF